uniref:FRIGIDA-like protein n=1 Tax=Steinernema glaseri TaxID=37863 RepID=A0A1I7Y3E1_9BILA
EPLSLIDRRERSLYGRYGQPACDLLIKLVGQYPILYKTSVFRLHYADTWKEMQSEFDEAFMQVVKEMKKVYPVDPHMVFSAWKSIRVSYFSSSCSRKYIGKIQYLNELDPKRVKVLKEKYEQKKLKMKENAVHLCKKKKRQKLDDIIDISWLFEERSPKCSPPGITRVDFKDVSSLVSQSITDDPEADLATQRKPTSPSGSLPATSTLSSPSESSNGYENVCPPQSRLLPIPLFGPGNLWTKQFLAPSSFCQGYIAAKNNHTSLMQERVVHHQQQPESTSFIGGSLSSTLS